MPNTVGPQAETDYWPEYFWLTKKYGDSGKLHELRKSLWGQKSNPSDFFAWFSTVESHLAEFEPARKAKETHKIFVKTVCLLAESHDPYTAKHQRKVAMLAESIAREMGLPADMIEGIRVAGMVHDIGKMSLPTEIVTKPGALTPLEVSIIKEHPRKGCEILKGVEFPWPTPEIVLQHHERLDGSGYPRGLKGDEIRLEARVLAVADVVEAIYSSRAYKPGLGIKAALKEIDKHKGGFYDTDVARACLRSLKGEKTFTSNQWGFSK
jgi:putative nucleotidyltransferase with HDIG domain